MRVDAFDGDRCIVDQNADGKRQPAERHDIDGFTASTNNRGFLTGSGQLPITSSLGAIVSRPRNMVACCRQASIGHDARHRERADHRGCGHKGALD
jgi:hypothetical protein